MSCFSKTAATGRRQRPRLAAAANRRQTVEAEALFRPQGGNLASHCEQLNVSNKPPPRLRVVRLFCPSRPAGATQLIGGTTATTMSPGTLDQPVPVKSASAAVQDDFSVPSCQPPRDRSDGVTLERYAYLGGGGLSCAWRWFSGSARLSCEREVIASFGKIR